MFARVAGNTAIETAIATSQAGFPTNGSANAVVLARSDFFSDALAGGPLAAAVDGPLLITEGAGQSSSLDPEVQAEIQRVLVSGGTVYILGGDLALSASIDATLQSRSASRRRGSPATDEYGTAVLIAQQLGNPATHLRGDRPRLPRRPLGGARRGGRPRGDPPHRRCHPGPRDRGLPGRPPERHPLRDRRPWRRRVPTPGRPPSSGTTLRHLGRRRGRVLPRPERAWGGHRCRTSPTRSPPGRASGGPAPRSCVPPIGALPGPSPPTSPVGGVRSATLFGGIFAVSDQVLAELDGAV